MRFTIPSETFTRIANVAARADDNRPALQCVRLEYRNGHYYVIASNSWMMAVEHLGETSEADGAVNVSLADPDTAHEYNSRNGDLVFDWYPDFSVLTGPAYGVSSVADADLPGVFVRWFDLFPVTPSKVDKGFLYFDGEYFTRLVASSPSGQLCFPEVIDNSRSIIVRDAVDPNWCGLFLASDKNKSARPAIRPEWMG